MLNDIQWVISILYFIVVTIISLLLPAIESKLIFMILVFPITLFFAYCILPLFEDFNG